MRIKSSVRSSAVAAVAGTLLTCTALAGVAAATTAPTFKEFKDATSQDAEGTYIFDGDEPAFNEGDLHEFYDALYGEEKGHIETDGLVVNRVAGRDDKWSATAALNITYCVSTLSFGLDHAKIVNSLNAAAAEWEAAARVNFIHKPLLDATCSKTSNVTFNVRKVTGAQYVGPGVLPEHGKGVPGAPGGREGTGYHDRPVDDDGRHAPRARPRSRLPARAHPAPGRNMLGGQQLEGSDHLRQRLRNALPTVPRDPGRRPHPHLQGQVRGHGALRRSLIPINVRWKSGQHLLAALPLSGDGADAYAGALWGTPEYVAATHDEGCRCVVHCRHEHNHHASHFIRPFECSNPSPPASHGGSRGRRLLPRRHRGGVGGDAADVEGVRRVRLPG